MAIAQQAPQQTEDVAGPGGNVPGAPPIALVKVADGFSDPTNVASVNDGSGRLFVVERVGTVRVVDRDGNVLPEPFLDLTAINPLGSDVQTGFVEQGLYSIAFHPDFGQNGYFYVHYASLPFNGDGVIVRFQVDGDSPNVMTPERTNQTAKVLLRIPQPYYNHNGGQIAFGPDGYLYIGSGDGGWEGDPLLAGQDLATLLRKHLQDDSSLGVDELAPQRGRALPEAVQDPGSLLLVVVGGRARAQRLFTEMLALSEDEAQRAAEQALKPSRIEIVLVKPKDRQARHDSEKDL